MFTNLNWPASRTKPWLYDWTVGTTFCPKVRRTVCVNPGKNILIILSSIFEFFVIKTVWPLSNHTSTDWGVIGKLFGRYDLKSNAAAVIKARDSRVLKLPLSSCCSSPCSDEMDCLKLLICKVKCRLIKIKRSWQVKLRLMGFLKLFVYLTS